MSQKSRGSQKPKEPILTSHMIFMILLLLIRMTNLLLLIWWCPERTKLRVEWLVLFVEHTIGRWLLNNSYISLVAHAATRADKEGEAKAFEGELDDSTIAI